MQKQKSLSQHELKDLKMVISEIVNISGKKVYELRIDYAKGYRVYFINKQNAIVLLLLGGDKSTQKSDIEKAVKMAEEIV